MTKFTEREAYIINCLAVFGKDKWDKDFEEEILCLEIKKAIYVVSTSYNDDGLCGFRIAFRNKLNCKVKRKSILDLHSKQYWTFEPPYTGRMSDIDQYKLTIIRD